MTTAPTGKGLEIAEVAPDRCASGHKLRAGTVLVGWNPSETGGRTYLCRTCGMQTTVSRAGVVREEQMKRPAG